jgi:C4-dicarboxylate-binding protein DctP
LRQLNTSPRDTWVAVVKPVWEKIRDDVGQTNIDAAQAINAKQ